MIPLAHASRTQAPASTPASALNPNQALAFDLLLPFLQGASEAHMAVLEGYAGSGKTFLVAHLLAALEDFKIAVAAPTHKAVRVLRDQLASMGVSIADNGDDPDAWKKQNRSLVEGCTCRSIHSILGLKLTELETGHQEISEGQKSSLHEFDIAIIDECSMLDTALFRRLIAARGECRLLFVGDPNQLPPVSAGAGAVAAISPVFERVTLKVRLTEVVRQSADNPIIKLSMRLRQLIEANVRATPEALLDALPPLAGSKAALVGGTAQTLVDWYLNQREDDPESDTRIIAFTNDRVLDYNRRIHQALHGSSGLNFVPDERVIIQKQCEAKTADTPFPEIVRLITSEELVVVDSESRTHPLYSDILAERVRLRSEGGVQCHVWIAADPVDLQRRISACFAAFREFKACADQAENKKERIELKQKSRDESDRGWALSRAFAPLRHAYAITAHKSQGSTFDCALVDFSDLAKMPDAFSFNRALYVAVTRSRQFLALVVT